MAARRRRAKKRAHRRGRARWIARAEKIYWNVHYKTFTSCVFSPRECSRFLTYAIVRRTKLKLPLGDNSDDDEPEPPRWNNLAAAARDEETWPGPSDLPRYRGL